MGRRYIAFPQVGQYLFCSDPGARLEYNPVLNGSAATSCSSVCEGYFPPFHKSATLAPQATQLSQLPLYAEQGNVVEVYRFLFQYAQQPGRLLLAGVMAEALERQHAWRNRDSMTTCRNRLLGFLNNRYAAVSTDSIRAGLLDIMARACFALGDMHGCENRISQLRTMYPGNPRARTILPLLLSAAMARRNDGLVDSVLQGITAANLDRETMHTVWSMKRIYDRVLPRRLLAKSGSEEAAPGSDGYPCIMTPADQLALRNFPNPFNPSTIIEFGLPQDSHVSLRVYNLFGRLMSTLVNDDRVAGVHSIEFSADRNAPTGMYLVVLTTEYGMKTSVLVFAK